MNHCETVLQRQFNEGDLVVRLNILKSSVGKQDEATTTFLIEAMGDAAWQVRKEAVATLSSMDNKVDLVHRVIERIGDNSSVGRRNAAVELFILWGKICVPPLLEHITKINEDTQKVLIDVLGDIGDPTATSFLLTDILGEEPLNGVSADFADNIRSSALEALGKLRPSDEVVLKILPFLAKKESPLLIFSAIKALEKMGSSLAVSSLMEISKEKVFQRTALEALGKIADMRALDCLLIGFHGASESIRGVAIKGIVHLESRQTEEDKRKIRQAVKALYREQDYTFLQTILHDHTDPLLKQGALQILGWVSETRSVLTFISLLQDYEKDVIEGLMAMGLPVLPSLLNLAERGVWEQEKTRYAVASVLSALPHMHAVPLLLDLLNDESEWVREVAVHALGKIPTKEVIPPLLSMLKDPYPEVQEAARRALLALASDLPMSIVAHLLEEKSSRLRANAALLLGELQYEEAIPSIGFLIKDSDETVRRSAVCALRFFLPREDVRTILLQALGDEDYKVRVAVLQVIQGDPFPALLGHLAPMAYDENIWVRAELARALAVISGMESLKLLFQLAEDSTGMVRIAALTSLGQRHEDGILAALSKHLHALDRDVQKAAILALGTLGNPVALDILLPFLSDPHWELRAAAVSAVGNLKGVPSQLKQISECDEDPLVRSAAAMALAHG